ncbi:MAG: hypothetical protein ACK4OM_03190 [Alphaproteobacteria bacterium]
MKNKVDQIKSSVKSIQINKNIAEAINMIIDLYNCITYENHILGKFRIKQKEEFFINCDKILKPLIRCKNFMDPPQSYTDNIYCLQGLVYFVNEQYDKAQEYFLISKKYNTSNGLEEFYLGQIYCFGYGTDKNYNCARDWLIQAVQKNNLRAAGFLGEYFNSKAEQKLKYETQEYNSDVLKSFLNKELNRSRSISLQADLDGYFKGHKTIFDNLENLSYIFTGEERIAISRKLKIRLEQYLKMDYLSAEMEYNPKSKTLDQRKKEILRAKEDFREFFQRKIEEFALVDFKSAPYEIRGTKNCAEKFENEPEESMVKVPKLELSR